MNIPRHDPQIPLKQTTSTNTPPIDDDNKEKRINELEENMQMMTTTIIALEEKIRRLEDQKLKDKIETSKEILALQTKVQLMEIEMKKPKPQLNDLINKYQELYYKIDELIKLRN